MIQMCSMGLVIDPRTGQQILLLTEREKKRVIPIGISLSDANSINMAVNGVKTLRPLTHELLLNVIRQLGHEVESVQIDLGGDEVFFATIKLKRAGSDSHNSTIPLIANPADAIAVAIRARAPIYVSEQVMTASIPADVSTDEKERQEFKQFVGGLNASDFKSEGLSNHL